MIRTTMVIMVILDICCVMTDACQHSFYLTYV